MPIVRPTSLDRDNHRPAQLPSCVTPVNTLTAPERVRALDRSRHPRRGSVVRVRTLSTTGLAWAVLRQYGNINPLSIDYACRPRLRSRLTQGGLTWPWNPWSSGGRGSHSSFATHACILTRVASTTGSPRRFTRHTTLPYPSTHLHPPVKPADVVNSVNATASAVCLSPATLSARNHLTSELLRTL